VTQPSFTTHGRPIVAALATPHVREIAAAVVRT